MQNAKVYSETNCLQKSKAAHFLEEFEDVFRGLKHCGKVLDVGCGEGEVLVNIFSPLFKTTIGIDISNDAIKFASTKYKSNQSVHFLTLDISREITHNDTLSGPELEYLKVGSFDLVTSFYTLQWVGNQR